MRFMGSQRVGHDWATELMISKAYQIRLPIIASSHALVLSGFAHSCQPQLFTLIPYTQKEYPYLSDFAFAVSFPQNFLPHIFAWLTPLPCSCLSPVSPSGRVLTIWKLALHPSYNLNSPFLLCFSCKPISPTTTDKMYLVYFLFSQTSNKYQESRILRGWRFYSSLVPKVVLIT